MFNRHFFITALTFLLLAVSFIYFDLMHAYSYKFWWWDSYEHFLGGIMVGFFLIWALSLRGKAVSIAQMVVFILVIGLAWESIEVIYPMGVSPYMSWEVDTIKDLVLDTLGALLALYASRRSTV